MLYAVIGLLLLLVLVIFLYTYKVTDKLFEHVDSEENG
jgi:hypothetical protein